MLINLKTTNGHLLVNTDNIDCLFFNNPEERLYVNRRGMTEHLSYHMKGNLIDNALEQIHKMTNENKQKTDTD